MKKLSAESCELALRGDLCFVCLDGEGVALCSNYRHICGECLASWNDIHSTIYFDDWVADRRKELGIKI